MKYSNNSKLDLNLSHILNNEATARIKPSNIRTILTFVNVQVAGIIVISFHTSFRITG